LFIEKRNHKYHVCTLKTIGLKAVNMVFAGDKPMK
jgi:hypothetical protein